MEAEDEEDEERPHASSTKRWGVIEDSEEEDLPDDIFTPQVTKSKPKRQSKAAPVRNHVPSTKMGMC